MGRPGYPAEFRREVLDLLAEGRSVASIAHDLGISDTISASVIRRSTRGAGKIASIVASSRA